MAFPEGVDRHTRTAADPDRDPLVRLLFDIMIEQDISAAELSRRTMGQVGRDTIVQWRRKSTPNVTSLRICFEALGYSLIARDTCR